MQQRQQRKLRERQIYSQGITQWIIRFSLVLCHFMSVVPQTNNFTASSRESSSACGRLSVVHLQLLAGIALAALESAKPLVRTCGLAEV